MKIEFDLKKSLKNMDERGLPFDLALELEFDWEAALYYQDEREDYKENRFIAIGYIEIRLHVGALRYAKMERYLELLV